MSTPTVLTTGANAPIGHTEQLRVRVEWGNSPADLDVSCFMVGENGKVPSDDYFIFYNQDASPGGQVRYERTGPNGAAFTIRTNELDPTAIAKCVFSATLDGTGTFADVQGCRIVAETANGEILYEIKEAAQERSMVFMELYRHASGLKLRAIGRGFNGGLKRTASRSKKRRPRHRPQARLRFRRLFRLPLRRLSRSPNRPRPSRLRRSLPRRSARSTCSNARWASRSRRRISRTRKPA